MWFSLSWISVSDCAGHMPFSPPSFHPDLSIRFRDDVALEVEGHPNALNLL